MILLLEEQIRQRKDIEITEKQNNRAISNALVSTHTIYHTTTPYKDKHIQHFIFSILYIFLLRRTHPYSHTKTFTQIFVYLFLYVGSVLRG